jgi:hypothetical protein
MAEEEQQGVPIRATWDRVEDLPILLVNQTLGQIGQQGEVILTFGQVTLPVLLGDPEQQRQQASEIPSVPIKPVARVALTRAGLEDLIRILDQTRANYDTMQETIAEQLTERGERQ